MMTLCDHNNKYHVLTVSLNHHSNQHHVRMASLFITTGTTRKMLNTCQLISVRLRANRGVKLGQDGVSLLAGCLVLLVLLSVNSCSVTDLSFFVSDVVIGYNINTLCCIS
jgi:hypothetical protein